MSAPPTAGPRTTWLTVAVVGGVVVSLAAGLFELDRALAGNSLSWVYALEWPLIGGYLVYLRHRLVRDASSSEHVAAKRNSASFERDAGSTTHPVTGDADLVAWQDYLARLRESSPPGGPPSPGATRGEAR